jgi:hypothetical protein
VGDEDFLNEVRMVDNIDPADNEAERDDVAVIAGTAAVII